MASYKVAFAVLACAVVVIGILPRNTEGSRKLTQSSIVSPSTLADLQLLQVLLGPLAGIGALTGFVNVLLLLIDLLLAETLPTLLDILHLVLQLVTVLLGLITNGVLASLLGGELDLDLTDLTSLVASLLNDLLGEHNLIVQGLLAIIIGILALVLALLGGTLTIA